jgi:hypothetical protein
MKSVKYMTGKRVELLKDCHWMALKTKNNKSGFIAKGSKGLLKCNILTRDYYIDFGKKTYKGLACIIPDDCNFIKILKDKK